MPVGTENQTHLFQICRWHWRRRVLYAYSSLHFRERPSCHSRSSHGPISTLYRHWRHGKNFVARFNIPHADYSRSLSGSIMVQHFTFPATLLGLFRLLFKAFQLSCSSSACFSATSRPGSSPSKIDGSKHTKPSPKFDIYPWITSTSKPSMAKWSLNSRTSVSLSAVRPSRI